MKHERLHYDEARQLAILATAESGIEWVGKDRVVEAQRTQQGWCIMLGVFGPNPKPEDLAEIIATVFVDDQTKDCRVVKGDARPE